MGGGGIIGKLWGYAALSVEHKLNPYMHTFIHK